MIPAELYESGNRDDHAVGFPADHESSGGMRPANGSDPVGNTICRPDMRPDRSTLTPAYRTLGGPPEQSLGHYGAHVIYAAAQLPLVVVAARAVRPRRPQARVEDAR